jgi:electron transfer flavoprotein alpha/beta subunit
MKDILGAAKKPTEVLALGALDVSPAVVTASVTGTSQPARGNRGGVRISNPDPAAAAAELVGALRASGAL